MGAVVGEDFGKLDKSHKGDTTISLYNSKLAWRHSYST